MKYMHWLVRHPRTYLAISTLLVTLAASLGAWLTYRNIEADRELPLVKSLGAFAATMEGGTINSQAMGAAIQFGLENQEAKRLARGELPPDSPAILPAMAALRRQFIADTVFLVNKKGVIVAYSGENNTRRAGADMSSWPDVQLAIQGTPNVYPAAGSVKSDRGIYLAAPLRTATNHQSASIGAVVVKVGANKLDMLLDSWTDGIVVLLSPEGVVFASNREDWLLRKTGEISADRIAGAQPSGQSGKVLAQASLSLLPFTLDTPETSIDGVRYAVRSLTLEWHDPEGDWRLVVLERGAAWWTDWSVLGVAGLAGLIAALTLFGLYTLGRSAVLLKKSYRELESAQLRLRKNESRLHAILDNSPIGIWQVGADGRYHFVNNTFCRAVGVSESEFISADHLADILGPDVAAGCIKSDRECLEQNEPHVSHETVTFADGKPHLLEITKVRLHESEYGADGIIGISIDITERQLAEQRLNDLLAFNKLILEKSPSGIAVFMDSGPCIMANEAYARTIGAMVEDVLQLNFRHNASWQRNGLVNFATEAFETGEAIRRDIEGATSFGKRVVLDCIFAPIDISGRRHLLLLTNDVSGRVEAQRALIESMRQLEDKELAKTRFLAAAGHDMRQPLAAANLFIDALKFTEPTAEQNRIIQRLEQTMATFNGLLDALLNISKLDAGAIRPEYTSINVTELINWLEQTFAPLAAEKKLGFRLYFPMKQALAVHSDIGLVKSVLMNLVSNAIKFTPKGAVLISARPRGGEVLFQVWDTGMGIEAEPLEHIFDEFYQVNNPQRDRSSGLGLGLSIAKRALALLGGKIMCRSRIGHGTVFGFSLPMGGPPGAAGRRAATEALQDDMANETFARGRHFVVVEDDALVAQATVNWLEEMGGEVECFHNAEDALLHAREQADCYIVDYMLGGAFNGIQFLSQLRRKLGKSISAVLVTGDTSPSFIRAAADCDWPVLHKPVNASQLISNLRVQEAGISRYFHA